jgi:magnesium-transporting ATPase (P-type)
VLGLVFSVVLHHNSEVPADAVILHSSHEKGRCLVETASLDGETNFKLKVAPIVLQRAIESQCSERDSEHSARVAQLVRSASGQFACEAPNSRLDLFKGRLNIQIGNTSFMGDDALNIDASNLVLRGTIIKNTDCVMALVVYTGDETKIRMNCARIGAAPITKSNLMLTLDRILMYQFVAQLVLCLIFGVLSGSMIKTLKPVWYLRLDKGINATVEGVYRFFSWIIVFAIMVPISLIVSSEVPTFFFLSFFH